MKGIENKDAPHMYSSRALKLLRTVIDLKRLGSQQALAPPTNSYSASSSTSSCARAVCAAGRVYSCVPHTLQCSCRLPQEQSAAESKVNTLDAFSRTRAHKCPSLWDSET